MRFLRTRVLRMRHREIPSDLCRYGWGWQDYDTIHDTSRPAVGWAFTDQIFVASAPHPRLAPILTVLALLIATRWKGVGGAIRPTRLAPPANLNFEFFSCWQFSAVQILDSC